MRLLNPILTPVPNPNRTPNRTANPTPTNERTNGLTEKSDTCANHLISVTRAGGAEAFDTCRTNKAAVTAARTHPHHTNQAGEQR